MRQYATFISSFVWTLQGCLLWVSRFADVVYFDQRKQWKTFKNYKKYLCFSSCVLHEPLVHMMKKVLFSSFLNVFLSFLTMQMHAQARVRWPKYGITTLTLTLLQLPLSMETFGFVHSLYLGERVNKTGLQPVSKTAQGLVVE